MEDKVISYVKETLVEIAEAIETGSFGKRTRVGITTLGSEHGEMEVIRGAELASKRNRHIDVVVIGHNVATELELIKVGSEEEAHEVMDRMLAEGNLDAAVTMHYSFPIGVSTVGRVITPGKGTKMFIANTTGTTDTNRVVAMIKNTISGIAVAKACGIKKPTVGILNIDGARQVEKALKKLELSGYDIEFEESARSDGGIIMRGNDLLLGVPNVMTMDSLTGNVMMKIFGAYGSGGSYESIGYGYGPGVGEGYDRIVSIISRASGANVIAGAIGYAGVCAYGKLLDMVDDEFYKANLAGLKKVVEDIKNRESQDKPEDEVKMPASKPTPSDISGIEILELDDAVVSLWKEDIYATSGMGCTGPIVMVADDDLEKAREILKDKGYL